MIGKLRSLFKLPEASGDQDEGQDRIQLSIAVLLVEIARADHDHQEVEEC